MDPVDGDDGWRKVRSMRVTDATLAEVRERGFSIVEGFLGPEELAAAQDALWLHFPRPEDYFADPDRFDRYGASQFAGVEEFPYRSWDLNGLAVHPELVDAAERYLETTDLHLYKVELWAKYADAVDYDRGEYRACLRPMTPDGRPIVGTGRHRNLFLNAGHGHMGWTMAFGTARIVADLMAGRKPEHDPAGLGPRSGAGGF